MVGAPKTDSVVDFADATAGDIIPLEVAQKFIFLYTHFCYVNLLFLVKIADKVVRLEFSPQTSEKDPQTVLVY